MLFLFYFIGFYIGVSETIITFERDRTLFVFATPKMEGSHLSTRHIVQ